MFLSDRVTTSRSTSLLLLSAGAIVATFAIVLWTSSLPTSSSSLLQSDGAKTQRVLMMMVDNDQDDEHHNYMKSMEAMAVKNTVPAAISSSFQRFNRDLQESSSVPIDPVLFSGSGDDFYCELLDDGHGDDFICLRTTSSIAGTPSPGSPSPSTSSWFFPYRDYEGFFACICKLPLEAGVPNFTNKNCEYCNVVFQIAVQEDHPNDDTNNDTSTRDYLPCLSSSFTNPTTSTDSYTIQFDCSNVFRLVGLDHDAEPCVGVDENGECFSLFNVPAPTQVESTYTIPQPEERTFCSEEPFESMNTDEERYQGRHICPTYTGFPYPDTQARTIFFCKDDFYGDDLDCICEIYMEFYSRETMCQSCDVHSNGSDKSLRVSFDCSNLFVGPNSAVSAPIFSDRGDGGDTAIQTMLGSSNSTIDGTMRTERYSRRRAVVATVVSTSLLVTSVMAYVVWRCCYVRMASRKNNNIKSNNSNDEDMKRIQSFFGIRTTSVVVPPQPQQIPLSAPRTEEIVVPALLREDIPTAVRINDSPTTTASTTTDVTPWFVV